MLESSNIMLCSINVYILQLEMMENLKEEKIPDCIEFFTVKRKLLLLVLPLLFLVK